MKTTILILALALIALSCYSQTDVKRTEEYCLVLATQKFMSLKLTIYVDYGQERNYWKDTRERDSTTGKVAVYESVIDALNYMNSKGWMFVNAYAISTGNQNVYHYLMRREIKAE